MSSIESPALSVVIPVLNEEALLRANLEELAFHLDAIVGRGRWQFVLVDNGSTDRTPRIIKEILAENPGSKSVHLPGPNYGAALRAGFKNAEADFVYNCDLEQWDIPFLAWAWNARDQHDLFIGSKRADPTICRQSGLRYFLSWGLNTLIQHQFAFMGTDTHGPKLVNLRRLKPLIESCISDRGMFDTEIVLRALRQGFRLAEAPIAFEEHRPPRNNIVKKVVWNVFALYRLRERMKAIPYRGPVEFRRFARSDVLSVYEGLQKTRAAGGAAGAQPPSRQAVPGTP